GKPSVFISLPPKEDATTNADSPFPGPTHRVEPLYPINALRRGVQGNVEALMHVTSAGEVEKVVIVPGLYSWVFGDSVRDALRRWHFPAGERTSACLKQVVVFHVVR